MTTPDRTIVFVDLETTGLEDDYHETWEIALIIRDPDALDDTEHRWFVEPDLTTADPEALRIGRFYERTVGVEWDDPGEAARTIATATTGAVLVGCNSQFDMRFLAAWLRAHGQRPLWHYRPVDVGALAYGWLCGKRAEAIATGEDPDDLPDLPSVPWNSTDLAALLGVERGVQHEALPDARFARDVFDAVHGSIPETTDGAR